MHRRVRLLLSAILLAASASFAFAQAGADAGWPTYGGDAGGQRYSAATAITRQNIAGLHPVWTYHTGALDAKVPGTRSAAFESTPVLFEDKLYFTTPFDKVVALDPLTGAEKWTFEPGIPRNDLSEGMLVTSRGVALYDGAKNLAPDTPCRSRVFFGTLVGQLIALDAHTGKPCQDFGSAGRIDLRVGVHYVHGDNYSVTSAPTVLGDVVVVGSSVSDNVAVDIEAGTVRGFDVHTGRLVWSWDPIPWAEHQAIRTGAANAWSTISADPQLGLIYVPTGSASPDYYGGMRPGDNRDADSVVAIEAATGRKVWAFQTVHHNLWDYDVASEPLLFTFRGTTPAIAITTKTGMVFVLDRRTGVPLYPVEERSVPRTDVPGEVSSPTQPFSSLPSLSPLTLPTTGQGSWKRSEENQRFCAEQISGLRYDGIYTPPSIRGSLMFPGNIGGVNWGSPAFDPVSGTLFANTNRLAFAVHLIDRPAPLATPLYLQRKKWVLFIAVMLLVGCLIRKSVNPGWIGAAGLAVGLLAVGLLTVKHRNEVGLAIEAAFGKGISPQRHTPYQLLREPLYDHDRNPCLPPPWGGLTALNLNTGKIVWNRELGSMYPGAGTGSLNLGGPAVTASGLLFTAGTREPAIRAFDTATGEEVWKSALPVPAQATPMTYSIHGRQFVVVAAGGHGTFMTAQGDSLIAFSLNQ